MMLPFVEAIKKIQSQKTVTISRCFGYTKALLYSLDNAGDGLSEQGVKAIRYLLGEMNIQLKMIYNSDAEDYNPIYLIAAALDPNTIGILSDIDLIQLQNGFARCYLVNN
ncbi:hypothetical protein DdX_20415 [Ditylenchus destructor]|uniref:Uncharacterized protein n=1 Tax=Ditylenchus destructor TaxID=166010 RepID=A0AAD4MKT9_9BILA|nr:hypothetical protein DdX_20415 [Ditylenchus destructor]